MLAGEANTLAVLEVILCHQCGAVLFRGKVRSIGEEQECFLFLFVVFSSICVKC